MKKPNLFFTAAALCSFLFNTTSILAQSTAFTYQGQLVSGGSPANGSYDLTFALYASSNGVSSQAGPVTNLAVFTTNGLFTTSVDFGPGVFAANSNYLAIAVRTNGTGAFTTLSPRQPVTSTPYAIYAASAASAATASSVSAVNVSGTLADTHLSGNVALRSGGNAFTGSQTINSGYVGIGTTTPNYRLSLGSDNSNTKLAIWDGTTTGMGFGVAPGQFRFHLPDTSNRFSFLSAPAGWEIMTILGIGRVGIGTTNPAADFHVVGITSYSTAMFETADPGGTWLRLVNDSAGGREWDFISSGAGNGEGAGKLLIRDNHDQAVRMAFDTNGNVIVTGNLRLGNGGANYAPQSGESLRLVRGFVKSDGTVVDGTGFSVAKNSPGDFTITFSNSFSNLPATTVTPVGSYLTVTINAESQSIFEVQFNNGLTPTDPSYFNFIAVGPP